MLILNPFDHKLSQNFHLSRFNHLNLLVINTLSNTKVIFHQHISSTALKDCSYPTLRIFFIFSFFDNCALLWCFLLLKLSEKQFAIFHNKEPDKPHKSFGPKCHASFILTPQNQKVSFWESSEERKKERKGKSRTVIHSTHSNCCLCYLRELNIFLRMLKWLKGHLICMDRYSNLKV